MAGAPLPRDAASAEKKEIGFYEPYVFFARTVRTWFMAYGIGVPVLLFGNAEAWKAMVAKGAAPEVIRLFLIGVALQVLTGIIFKGAMWYQYMEEIGELSRTSKRYRLADGLSNAYWPEAAIEVVTLALFSYATWRALVTV